MTIVLISTPAIVLVSPTSLVSSSLFAILTDKDGTTMEFGVLKLTDGTSGFGWFLVDDNATALGTAIISFEDISLLIIGEKWKRYEIMLLVTSVKS